METLKLTVLDASDAVPVILVVELDTDDKVRRPLASYLEKPELGLILRFKW